MKKIVLILILTLLFTSCSNEEQQIISKNYKTDIVRSGSVDSTNSTVGYTSGIKQVMLATKSPGRITLMSKNVGDKVYAGELLARLDSAEAITGYNTANNITNSLIALKGGTSKALDEQIKAMEAKIESIKAQAKGVNQGVTDTKDITNSQLQTAKVGLETAKLNLEQTKNSLSTKKDNIIKNSSSAITQSVILDENIIDFTDKLLGVTKENKDFNDDIEDYVGVKNSNQLKSTKTLFLDIKKYFDEYKTFYETNIENKSPSEQKIVEGLKLAKSLAEKQKILLKELYKVMDNSIVNIYLPATAINSYKSQISTFGTNVENSLLTVSGNYIIGIKGSLENLKSFETEKTKAISLLEKQVALAEANLTQYENIANSKVNNIETQKKVADLGLEEAQAGLEALKAQKNASLKEIDAKIAEANGGKNSAGVMINNGKIIAPFSGIITKKMAETGQVINGGMPIYELANTKIIKIKTSVSNSIYKNIKLNDIAKISIEGLEKEYDGKITLISKSANTITKKYDIEINIDNSNLKIPAGAMAKINFNTYKTTSPEIEDQGQQSIIIPNSAIIGKFMIPGVYVLQNNKAIFKSIEIIKMGEQFSEIKGLNSGEIIITSGKENIFDGEKLK